MAEPISYQQASGIQRGIRRFASAGPGSWLFARVAHRIDRPIYRLTRGRHTLSTLISGIPVVMLTTTGAKSGRPRTVPVLGLPTGDGLAVIASNFGQHRHPAWYHKPGGDPGGEGAVRGTTKRLRAGEGEGRRRARIWKTRLKN